MFSRFGKDRTQGTGGHSADRVRPSRGWVEVLAYLKANDSLRVLDFGTTSSVNINFLTSLGHSVYMANVVQDANKPEWKQQTDAGEEYDVDGFVKSSLDFSGRDFDVILLWDTANYLPAPLVPPYLNGYMLCCGPRAGYWRCFMDVPRDQKLLFLDIS